jgi:hypothetical protein
MAGKALALLAALALAGAMAPLGSAKSPRAGGGSGTAPPAVLPSGSRPATPPSQNVQPQNVQPRSGGAATTFGGESDLTGLILLALGAVVVLLIVPTQVAKTVAARRAALSRSARSDSRNRPNDA